MVFTLWCLVIGLILVVMALSGSFLRRLPLSASMFYLAAGFALGPAGLALFRPDPIENAALLERLTEVAVLVSLFSAGLKLRVPLAKRRWALPVRLASVSMVLTVAAVAVVGVFGLGLPLGAAVLLGAVLAPTDPVLASDVQMSDPYDTDRLRFALTGEAGLNDGTAFPFVMLGLGLLGLHPLGEWGWRWWTVDLFWAVGTGIAVGAVLGTVTGRLVLFLRQRYQRAVGLDEFLTLGLIALSAGAAGLVAGYSFLAVFAAGVALRRVEVQETGEGVPEEVTLPPALPYEEAATHPEKAPAYLAAALLGFNESVERIAEVAVVVTVGGMLAAVTWQAEMLWFIPLLLLALRPAAVAAGLARTRTSATQRALTGWFGIRGVGSIYYLMFAISHGLPGDLGARLASLVLAVVAVSIVVHGVSVTPLMERYQRQQQQGQQAGAEAVAAN